MIVARLLYHPVPTVLSGQTLEHNGDEYRVTQDGEVVTSGRIFHLDDDLLEAGPVALAVEVMRLRSAIRRHRDEKGHDRCWHSDVNLYGVLPDTMEYAPMFPPLPEFLKKCEEYHAAHCPGRRDCHHDGPGRPDPQGGVPPG